MSVTDVPPSTQPRSALRYRPITPTAPSNTDEHPPRADALLYPGVQRASRVQRPPVQSSHPQSSPKATPVLPSYPTPSTGPLPATFRKHGRSRLWKVLIAGVFLVFLAVFLEQMVVGWFITTWNDWHYGRPRTYQIDAYVGHESGSTPSHFIAINLHGQVQVVEWPGGDSSRLHIYLGPHLVGDNADLALATIQFLDSRHDHHPDLLVQAGGLQMLFHNDQDMFRPV